jgi:hypothetical protein
LSWNGVYINVDIIIQYAQRIAGITFIRYSQGQKIEKQNNLKVFEGKKKSKSAL